MKTHLTNAVFGVLDYIAYPIGLLLLAPVILQRLGMERYGIWVVANAVLNTGAIIASGFGDANIRSVAIAREREGGQKRIEVVRSTLGIHIVLGALIAAATLAFASPIADSTTKMHPQFRSDCLWSLRIAAALILLRAIETVCVSTQRAFARYGAAIQVSVIARFLSLLAAAVIPLYGGTVAVVMAATLAIGACSVWIQFHQVSCLLGADGLLPLFENKRTRLLLGFGVFTWLQALGGLLFGQADRIIAGIAFGAATVSSYAFCVQLAQPIYGVTAAGLHFLFPHLASQAVAGSRDALRRSVLGAFVANFAFVAIALCMLLFFGKAILLRWAGPIVASEAAPLLPAIAWSSALSALGITGCYSLLALGRPRGVTALNLLGGILMLASAPLLVPRYGPAGLAYARLLFGPAVLLVYIPLFSTLLRRVLQPDAPAALPICEDA